MAKEKIHEITPDYIRGSVNTFKILQKLYFLTTYVEDGTFEQILMTDWGTAKSMWEKWMLFYRGDLSEEITGFSKIKQENRDKAEEDYNRCSSDPEYKAKCEEELEKNKKLLKAIFSVEGDELKVGDVVKDRADNICTVTNVDTAVHVIYPNGKTHKWTKEARFRVMHHAEDDVKSIKIELEDQK